MLLHQLIERLLRCERRIRRVYLALSDRVEFPPEMCAFWRDMAADENVHRAYLEHTAGLLNFVESPPEEAETILGSVEAKIAAAETAIRQPDLSLDDALGHALNLEDSELRSLEHTWLEKFHPSLESLMHATPPQEEEHIRRLVDAVQRFSTDATLQKQATVLWLTYQHQQSECAT